MVVQVENRPRFYFGLSSDFEILRVDCRGGLTYANVFVVQPVVFGECI